MGLAEPRCFFKRAQHLTPGFLELAGVAQQPSEVVMRTGDIGVVELNQSLIGGESSAEIAEILGGPCQCTVGGGHQWVNGQYTLGVLRNAAPVACGLVDLCQPQVRRNRVAVLHGQFLQHDALRSRLRESSVNHGQQEVRIVRPDVFRIERFEFFGGGLGFLPFLLNGQACCQPALSLKALGMLLQPSC